MKKIINTLLIVVLIVVQLVPILNVKAENTENQIITDSTNTLENTNFELVTNKAKLTLSRISRGTKDNSDEFKAYKTLDIYYNKFTNEMAYEFTNEFQAFLETDLIKSEYPDFSIQQYISLTSDNADGTASSSVVTTSTLNTLVSKYATYIREKKITGIKFDKFSNNMDGEDAYSIDLPAGSYLILPSRLATIENNLNTTRNIYGVMVGNIIFTVENNEWILKDQAIMAKKEEITNSSFLSNYDLEQTLNILASGVEIPSDFVLTKSIDTNFATNKLFVANLDAPQIPTNAISTKVNVEINIPKGISYNPHNIIYIANEKLIKIENNKIVDSLGVEIAKLEMTDRKISILFNENINVGYANIGFDIQLNNEAIVGSQGNEITTIITYPDDPYLYDSLTTLNSSVVLSTYGLELTNLSKGDSNLLKGAKYKYIQNILIQF